MRFFHDESSVRKLLRHAAALKVHGDGLADSLF